MQGDENQLLEYSFYFSRKCPIYFSHEGLHLFELVSLPIITILPFLWFYLLEEKKHNFAIENKERSITRWLKYWW